jgi:hypothetical protein
MKVMIYLILALLLTACAVTPTYFDGQSATYEHGTDRFGDVMADAQIRCASVGKLVKHERTDCPHRCISTFSCVTKTQP